jgi:hypothetical protein
MRLLHLATGVTLFSFETEIADGDLRTSLIEDITTTEALPLLRVFRIILPAFLRSGFTEFMPGLCVFWLELESGFQNTTSFITHATFVHTCW